MPNRKIKHIIAKVVGAQSEETLDVYDVDAIHYDDVVNNYTTTETGKVLDGRMGKDIYDRLYGGTQVYTIRGYAENGSNLNEITRLGTYMLNGGYTYTNCPFNTTSGNYGLLYVVRGVVENGFYAQIAFNCADSNAMYWRNGYYNSNTSSIVWRDWLMVQRNNEAYNIKGNLSGTNLNTVTGAGCYRLTSGETYTNAPFNWGLLYVIKGTVSNSYITQLFIYPHATNQNIRFRSTNDGGTTWSDWEKLATNLDFANRPAYVQKIITANATTTYTIANSTQAAIFITGSTTGTCLVVMVNATSTGVVSYQVLGTPTGLAFSSSTRQFKVISTNSNNPGSFAFAFTGSVS